MDPIQSWVDPDEVRRLAEGLISPPVRRSAPREEAGYGAEWVGFGESDGAPAPAESQQGSAPAGPPEAPPRDPDSVSPGQIHARRSLAAARRIAEESGLLATKPSRPPASPSTESSAAASSLPPEAPPTGDPAPRESPAPAAAGTSSSPFVVRLQRFGAWLRENFGARAFFVTNRDGDVLIDEVRSQKLLQVARTLAHASRTANRQAGGVAVGSLHIKLGPDGVLEVIPLNCRYGPLVLGVIVAEVLSPQHVEAAASGLQQVVDGSPGNP